MKTRSTVIAEIKQIEGFYFSRSLIYIYIYLFSMQIHSPIKSPLNHFRIINTFPHIPNDLSNLVNFQIAIYIYIFVCSIVCVCVSLCVCVCV